MTMTGDDDEAALAVRYTLVPGAAIRRVGGGLRVSGRLGEIDADDDEAELLAAVVEALRAPVSRGQLAERTGLDEETLDDVVEALTAVDVVWRLPPRMQRLDEALRAGGVVLVGESPVREALARALDDAGVGVTPVAFGEPLPPCGVVVMGPAPLGDRDVLEIGEGCRREGRLFLPLFLHGASVFVGPLVRPGSGPCARCLVLRVLARGAADGLDSFYESLSGARPTSLYAFDAAEAMLLAGHVATHLLSLGGASTRGDQQDAVLTVHLHAGFSTCRRVFPVPGCGACARPLPRADEVDLAAEQARATDAWKRKLRDDAFGAPSEKLREDLLDAIVGPLSIDEAWELSDHFFRHLPFCWGGVACIDEPEHLSTGLHGIVGTGETPERRRLVALSEGFERYALRTHRGALRDTPFSDVAEVAVDPRTLPLPPEDRCSSLGEGVQPFHPDLPLRWTWAFQLRTEEARLVPLELVATALGERRAPQRLASVMVSSGAASHSTLRAALYGAVRELVERDAFMCTWLKRIEPAPLDVPTPNGHPLLDEQLAFLRPLPLTLGFFDLRLDLQLPVVAAVARVEAAIGHLAVGSTLVTVGADADPGEALVRALRELILSWESFTVAPADANDWRHHPYDPNDPLDGRSPLPPSLYYLDPSRRGAFDFLWRSRRPRRALDDVSPLAHDGDPLAPLLADLEAHGMTPWAVDITAVDLVDAGFKQVRVLIPELVPLAGSKQLLRLPRGDRLERLARDAMHALPDGSLNPDPHPLV